MSPDVEMQKRHHFNLPPLEGATKTEPSSGRKEVRADRSQLSAERSQLPLVSYRRPSDSKSKVIERLARGRIAPRDLEDRAKLSSDLGKFYFNGKVKPKVKVIHIGPDPPGLFRKYIWGRTRKYCWHRLCDLLLYQLI